MNATLTDIEQFNKWHDTEFEQLPEYKLKTITFLNGTVDFICQRTNFKRLVKEAFYGVQVEHQRDKTEEELAATRLENIERAARRARQKVHYLVRQLGADHMLTLHTRENIQDNKTFDDYFQKFIRLVRSKRLTRNGLAASEALNLWQFVAVRELQERGALHMHIACVGHQNVQFLRACWYVALGGKWNDSNEQSLGNIDVQYSQKRFSGQTETHKTFKLVQYLCKYISKSFAESDILGAKRFTASRGTAAPIVNKQFLPVYWSAGDKSFTTAIMQVNSIIDFLGVKNVQLWNRQLDIFILRGEFE